ncbi:MAG: penicillin-binding transpeptidase domain-containing protein, partial [Bradymonadaceae bacterium]
PFDKLVPSYATALGSSADRPSALAELVGIVLSEGRRLPLVRFEALHFAEGTPFEVRHEYGGNAGREVLSPEVARVVRRAMEAVVSHGTGRPLRAGLVSSDGQGLKIAGKTGTADHRFHFYDRRGRITGSRAVNRTATWVFSVGDCHFGTIVAFVPDEKADDHTFMSALAVRILRVLEPAIAPLLEDAGTCH